MHRRGRACLIAKTLLRISSAWVQNGQPKFVCITGSHRSKYPLRCALDARQLAFINLVRTSLKTECCPVRSLVKTFEAVLTGSVSSDELFGSENQQSGQIVIFGALQF